MVEHDHELAPLCAATREEFSALLDDELSPAARSIVEAHLAECSDCLRALDNMKKVTDLYRALPNVSAPVGFEDAVRKALRPGVVAFPQRTRTIGLLALAAAAGLALMIVPFALRDSQRSVNSQLARENAEMRSAPESAAGAVPEQKAADAAKPMDAARKEQLEALGYLHDEKAKARQPAPAAAAAPAPAPAPTMPQLEPAEQMPARPAVGGAGAPSQAMPSEPTSQAMERKQEPKKANTPAVTQTEKKDAANSVAAPALQEEAASPEPMPESTAQAPAAPPAPPPPIAPEPASVLRVEPPMAKNAPEAPKDAKTVAENAPATSTQHVHGKPWKTAGRNFELQDEVWIQKGYDNSPTTALTTTGGEFKELTKRFPELRQLVAADKPVIFKAGDTWYRLTPRKK